MLVCRYVYCFTLFDFECFITSFLLSYLLHAYNCYSYLIRNCLQISTSVSILMFSSNRIAADVSTFAKTVISIHGNFESKRLLSYELEALERLSSGLDSEQFGKSRFISLPVSPAADSSEAIVGNVDILLDDENAGEKSSEYVNDVRCKTTSEVELSAGVEIISISGENTDRDKTVQDSPSSNVKTLLHDSGINIKDNNSEIVDKRLNGGNSATSNHDIASPTIKSHLNISDFADTTLESILSRDSSINISKIMGSEKSLLSSFISEGGILEEERKEGDIGEIFNNPITTVKMEPHLLNSPITTDTHPRVGDISNFSPPKIDSDVTNSIHSEEDGEQYSVNVGNLDYNSTFPSSSHSNNAHTNGNSVIVEGQEYNGNHDSGILDPPCNAEGVENDKKDAVIDSSSERCLLEKIRTLKKEEGALYFKLIKVSERNYER